MNSKALNIYEAAAAIIIMFAIQFLVVISVVDAGFSITRGDPRNSVITVLSTGILITILMKLTHSSYREIFHLSNNSVVSTIGFTCIPVFIVVVSFLGWLNDVLTFIISFFPEDRTTIVTLENMLSGGVVSIIAVCIVAPVIEEMLFRGMFLRGFLINYSPSKAIVYSSLLFAFIHLNIYQVPFAFVFGLFIGWLYFISRSLWPCIFAHALNNSIAYFIYSSENLSLNQYTYHSVLTNFLSILATCFAVYVLAKIYRLQLPKLRKT